MLDGVTLDQIRTFLAAVDEGSFSAAGRRLGRAQSVVSQTLANLEGQIGVRLFDRSARKPVLTEQGRALVVEARAVTGRMDEFKARAASLAGGLEAEVSIVVDVMFPMVVLTHAISTFQSQFPDTALRVHVEGLGATIEPVLDGRSAFAVTGALPAMPSNLVLEYLLPLSLIHVVAPDHALAAIKGPIARDDLAQHLQLVLTDRSKLTEGHDLGVYAPRSWRLADLSAKHDFLRAGLGWGSMPRDRVEPDLASGSLVEVKLADTPAGGFSRPIYAAHRADTPPGPAGRWLLERLKDTAMLCPTSSVR